MFFFAGTSFERKTDFEWKIRRLKPEIYEATAHISLVSSFIASVFLGRIAPIDISDASGMNLMDVLSCKWNERLLEICGGPTLRAKLGEEPVIGGTSLGPISSWWVKKWGFNPGINQPSCIRNMPFLLTSVSSSRMYRCSIHR